MNMNEYLAVPATADDVDAVAKILDDARAFMRSLGNPQWQDGFPGRDFISGKIADGLMYKLMCGDEIAAVFSVLDYDGDYDVIDGKWLTEDNYFVLHTVAVAAEYRGKGCARYIFAHARDMAKERGKASVRMDTHEKNVPMRTLVTSLGFTYCGTLRVRDGKPRVGYEKLV